MSRDSKRLQSGSVGECWEYHDVDGYKRRSFPGVVRRKRMVKKQNIRKELLYFGHVMRNDTYHYYIHYLRRKLSVDEILEEDGFSAR